MSAEGTKSNGWQEHQLFVLNELKRVGRTLEISAEAMQDLRIDVALLKFQAGIWGAIGGGILGVTVTIILKFVFKF